VQLANSDEVPLRLILGVDAEKRVQQGEAARASEAEKWRHPTVSTVFEDRRFDSRLYMALLIDQELEKQMRELPRAEGVPEEILPRTKACIYQRASKEPGFDLKRELFRTAGVDLTDVPGISTITARTILMEAGADVSRFRNASAFASWLGLCLDKRVQRRQGTLHENSEGEEPGCHCTAAGRALPLPCQELSRASSIAR
jgi:hypothetical protein